MSTEQTPNETMDSYDELLSEAEAPAERYLTFCSDGLTLGVSTHYVTEIITDHSITSLPIVPDYVRGIINLRGQIVPIIDIRLRMGKPMIDYTSTTCIIVLKVDSVNIGRSLWILFSRCWILTVPKSPLFPWRISRVSLTA